MHDKEVQGNGIFAESVKERKAGGILNQTTGENDGMHQKQIEQLEKCQKWKNSFRQVLLWIGWHKIHVNSKAVLRIMCKNSLLSQIRRGHIRTSFKLFTSISIF